jgi:hypothetical protein
MPTLIDPWNTEVKHGFSRAVAKKYGVNAALVLNYLAYKIDKSKHEHDGKVWYFDTVDNIAKKYPYLRRSAVYAALKALTAEDGLLVTGNYNKKHYDRTTWYAFKNKAAAKMVATTAIFFRIQDAMELGVTKAVLLNNLRYWINENRKEKPGYNLHAMSPTELADCLPFSRATIQRKLKELVEKDRELVSVTPLDGRDPAQYGFLDEVKLRFDFGIAGPKNCGKAKETANQPPHFGTVKIASSKPNPCASTPNTEGPELNDNTTLIDNSLKETLGKDLLKRPEPVLRPGSASSFSHSLLSASGQESTSHQDEAGNKFCEVIDRSVLHEPGPPSSVVMQPSNVSSSHQPIRFVAPASPFLLRGDVQNAKGMKRLYSDMMVV